MWLLCDGLRFDLSHCGNHTLICQDRNANPAGDAEVFIEIDGGVQSFPIALTSPPRGRVFEFSKRR
jgi:hypothetical protein